MAAVVAAAGSGADARSAPAFVERLFRSHFGRIAVSWPRPEGEEILMGYGFGGFLLVVGLILALAVTDRVNGVDLTMVGWIMALVGAVLIVVTALTWGRRGTRSVETTTHRDGTQSVSERRTEI
jgi:uncharacterized membrane protein